MTFSIPKFDKKTVGTEDKVPWIDQRHPGEDGLACVAIMLAYYDIKCSLKGLRKRYPQFAEGINLHVELREW